MGATRKLQGEIDRVLKKVQEGVDVFDSIWNKVYDTENANQKEKFEADLKKEIKKLQRYRDQIKTWIQSSEIKDKKVAASYDQALLDARKLIEREMERFKVCEKETKTKAFSKEGLGQQPKTDPKEKAKSESREWLNNMVSELESQIDSFEAEMEGLFVKKGKTRPPRLTHLEDSISRHKSHISKLELILRLLDNDELSPEQINDVKDFVEDYVDRNQDDFDEFEDVDELYNSLPLDKLEALETLDAVSSLSPVVPVKEKPVTPAVSAGTAQVSAPVLLGGGISEELSLDTAPQTASLPLSSSLTSPASSDTSEGGSTTSGGFVVPVTGGNPVLPQRSVVSPAGMLPGSTPIRGVNKAASVLLDSPPISIASRSKEEDAVNLNPQRVGSGITGIGRASFSGGLQSVQTTPLVPLGVSVSSFSSSGLGSNGGINSTSNISDINKRSGLVSDERVVSGGSFGQQLSTPISVQNRVFLPSGGKMLDPGATGESATLSEGGLIGSRLFTSGGQWRPHTASAFQNPAESGQVVGRTEIAPDQKQKFLQRFQQVHQGGHSAAILGAAAAAQLSHLSSTSQKQQQVLSSAQQTSLLLQNTSQTQLQLLQPQQQNSSFVQASQTVPLQQQQQAGLPISLAAPFPTSSSQQSIQQTQLSTSASSQQLQQLLLTSALSARETDVATNRVLDQHQQSQAPQHLQLQLPKLSEEGNTDTGALSSSYARAAPLNADDLKNADTFDVSVGGPGTLAELSQQSRDADFAPGQQVQSSQSPGPGVIGRRTAADLGAIGDNLTSPISGGTAAHDQLYNLQMLEAAYRHIPTPRDSERPRSYVPRNPAVVPPSYPQIPAAIIENPALWERLDPDVLFSAFYYQQNTYQQYLAARELKKQSWRYHKKYNTWFQRHEEPKVTTDEYEQGTYVYFDYNMIDDKHGWCQRIKAEFTFEYSYLEDELVV
ncbi:hypothetical protein O6H91_13G090700 [Diphasiastrum complanatum]|uniref:Uncharacterized protein n=1 Tax=Diphasiastrum complanatum TaxID=34168 RepID=A0ACC2BX55_DIPCM|nr:hypothetical protein O6H91_13G090700 [Diphasiastrum complanatum]